MEESLISKGIPLQLCDIFLQELNKSDSHDISLVHLSQILEPFLYSVANCRNKILIQRIVDKIFMPLLENNVTIHQETDESEEEEVINYDEKWVDGGKMSKKTLKEVQKLIDQRFNFPNFNILLYAQGQIFQHASSLSTREENREILYTLYDKALKLEPEPEEKELTFSQRMLVNRAKAFITKKMERRMRVHQQKRNKKLLYKISDLISSQIVTRSQALQDEFDGNDKSEESKVQPKPISLEEKQQIIDMINQ
jgi:hypothetical protein